MNSFLKKISLCLLILSFLSGCNNKPGNNISFQEDLPRIEPDYTGITIPPNIAPMNFIIKEEGSAYYARFSFTENPEMKVKSKSGLIQIPLSKWIRMVRTKRGKDLKIDIFLKDKSGQWKRFRTITNKDCKRTN